MVDSYLSSMLANGEVILIETRQHWIAALRYALRPILILLAAVGVLLLGAWLEFDGWLSGLNDLLYWLMILLFVIAVIWLPIDLIRWYSRRYVLTSRRAMRMQGVLRKSSIDSSLEQINDIRTEQSLIGRTLGYADLTIYTASEMAIERYAQLLDGLQFKKAVLEAKEAIRTGHPLTALPESFVVKGGQNEASRRAAGKASEAAADAEAAAAGGTGGTGMAGTGAAAGVAAAATVIEPSGEVPGAASIAPVVEPVAEVPPQVREPEPVVPPAVVPEPEPVVVPEPEPVVVPVPEPGVVPAPVMPEPEPLVVPEPEVEPLVVPEPEPVVEPEPLVRPVAEFEAAEDAATGTFADSAETVDDVLDSASDDDARR